MDEHLQSRLQQAWQKQKEGHFYEAMEIYNEVLNSPTLQNTQIEKHLQMK